MAVTTTGGISTDIFDEVETPMSLGESTMTSNLHQLTCEEYNLSVKGEIDSLKTKINKTSSSIASMKIDSTDFKTLPAVVPSS